MKNKNDPRAMVPFSLEQAEQQTYRDLVMEAKTEPDEETMKRSIAVAFHLSLITEQQMRKLAEIFYFAQDERENPFHP